MSLPKPIDALWSDLQAVRAEVLTEAERLSQRQADWKAGTKDWSVGEIAAPPGPAEAPPLVWPEHGKPIGELIATMKATRERSRQSIERLATLDPQKLSFKHFRLGDLDLAQWWTLQAQHDGIHLAQIRDVKRAPGFPPGA